MALEANHTQAVKIAKSIVDALIDSGLETGGYSPATAQLALAYANKMFENLGKQVDRANEQAKNATYN